MKNSRVRRGLTIASRIVAATAAVVGLSLAMSPAASAATPPPTSGPSAKGEARYCVIVLGKSDNVNSDSPVLYENCATSDAEAKGHLNNARVAKASGGFVTASSDLLMTWWADVNYDGYYTAIYGAAGTCDSAGYRVTPSSYWQVNITGITGAGQCNEADVISRSLTYADDFALPVAYIGDTLNDNVGRVQIYHL